MTAPPYKEAGPDHLNEWESRLLKPSFIYVIQGEFFGPIKVGFAHDVMDRLAGLQTGNPARLRLLHVLPGDKPLERFLHCRLAKSRLHHSEWFAYGEEVEAFLRWFAELAERALDRWDRRWDRMPPYHDLDPAFADIWRKPENPVTIRWVEPDPNSPEEIKKREQQRIMESAGSTWVPAPVPKRWRSR